MLLDISIMYVDDAPVSFPEDTVFRMDTLSDSTVYS